MNLSESPYQNLKYKEKLRLRGYGIPTLEDKVYLEIKKGKWPVNKGEQSWC